MAGAVGTISFAHAHLYVDFDKALGDVSAGATAKAQWDALKLKFPVGDYINKASRVTLPVAQANTFDVENMGAESAEKVAGLPSINDGAIEVGWINETGQILTLLGKKVNDDIACALIYSTDDGATRTNPLSDSTEATAAVFYGCLLYTSPSPRD